MLSGAIGRGRFDVTALDRVMEWDHRHGLPWSALRVAAQHADQVRGGWWGAWRAWDTAESASEMRERRHRERYKRPAHAIVGSGQRTPA